MREERRGTSSTIPFSGGRRRLMFQACEFRNLDVWGGLCHVVGLSLSVLSDPAM